MKFELLPDLNDSIWKLTQRDQEKSANDRTRRRMIQGDNNDFAYKKAKTYQKSWSSFVRRI